MSRITVAQTAHELDLLRPAWDSLARRPGLTLFQRYAWNRIVAEQLPGCAPFVVMAENSGGAAIIPAAIDHASGCLTLLGDTLFDYRDVFADDEEALAAAWRRLAELGRPFGFTALRSDSPNPCWEAVEHEDFTTAPGVSQRDATAEEFAAAHSRLGRQMRRLHRAGVELVRYSGRESGLVRWLYERKAAQLAGAPDNVFSEPARIECMVAIAAAEDENCEIFCLRRGSEIVSALLTFVDEVVDAPPVRRFYTIYFDPAWSSYSPGTVLVYEVTRASLASGLECDYMTGEQPHKLRLATRSMPLHRIRASADDLAALGDSLAATRMAA